MKEFKCQYCEKVYKTEKGLEKHLVNCKIKQRLAIYNLNSLLRYNFTWFYKYVLPLENQRVKNTQLPLFYCKSKYFDRLWKLTQFEESVELYSPEDYMNYLLINKININQWCLEKHLLEFLYDWSGNEPIDHAIYRSEKWLENHNYSLETINSTDLYLALRYGKISYKYIQYKKFNYEKELYCCDAEEIQALRYFLRD